MRRPRPTHRRRRSGHVRALLSLGMLLGISVTGTFAYWTDEVAVGGGTFTSGTLDLKVNDADAYATTTLGMTAMVPGNTSAEVLTIKNGGTAPLKYTLAGGLTGTDAGAYNAAGSLRLTITTGTRSGTGNAATCGGTVIYGPTALTSTTTTPILGTPRGPFAPTSSEALCFQITFDAAAPSSLQGRTASLSLTATGTSDVS